MPTVPPTGREAPLQLVWGHPHLDAQQSLPEGGVSTSQCPGASSKPVYLGRPCALRDRISDQTGLGPACCAWCLLGSHLDMEGSVRGPLVRMTGAGVQGEAAQLSSASTHPEVPLEPPWCPISLQREEPVCKFTRKAVLAEVLEALWSGQAFVERLSCCSHRPRHSWPCSGHS